MAPRRERLPAGISTGLFFEIGAVAIGIARGALDVYENVLRTKLTDVPPFTRRGDQVLYQHHLGRATGLVDLAEAGLFEAVDRYLAQANAQLSQAGRPSTKTARKAAGCCCWNSWRYHWRGRPLISRSGRPAQAERRHTAPWATRCSRLPSFVRTWVCNGTARWRTWAAYEWA